MDGIRFRISGRVQGVGFRAWARATADRLHVVGSVRNLPDGSVEVDAGGSDEALESFRRALRTGPPAAQVTAVSETPIRLDQTNLFSIRR